MTAPGLLDFFVLEASDYLEQLDRTLGGGARTPDLEAVQRGARGLRGSATMAKLPAFAELAAAVERVARAVRDGSVAWDRAVGGALVAAVDELKVLLHQARGWTEAETTRARARSAELLAHLPASAIQRTGSGGATNAGYLANETANVAAGLEFLLTAPGGGGDTGTQVLQRIRALRGIAAIRDVPALPEALEAAEFAAAPLEQGRTIGDAQREVLRLAGRVLRDLAAATRAGRPIEPGALQELEQRLDAWLDDEEGAGEPIVAIDSLIASDQADAVTATPNPPTTAAQRFQLEMVSNGEHLRLLVEEARTADPAARSRYRRHIRRSLRTVRRTAESFGERAAAEAITALASDLTTIDDAALTRLAAIARRLAAPGSGAALAQALGELIPEPTSERTPERTSEKMPGGLSERRTDVRGLPSPIVPNAVPSAVPKAVPPSSVPPSSVPQSSVPQSSVPPSPVRRPTPSGIALAGMLDRSVSAVGSISAKPLAEGVALDDVPVVPVSALLYRGKAALRRALELRNEMREAGGLPDPAAVDELFDLIELALVD